MTFKYDGKYWNYETVTDREVGYVSDIQTLYDHCVGLSKKYDVPLSKFDLEANEKWGDPVWNITFVRPATEEEEKSERELEEARRKLNVDRERQQYKALKKKFEGKN